MGSLNKQTSSPTIPNHDDSLVIFSDLPTEVRSSRPHKSFHKISQGVVPAPFSVAQRERKVSIKCPPQIMQFRSKNRLRNTSVSFSSSSHAVLVISSWSNKLFYGLFTMKPNSRLGKTSVTIAATVKSNYLNSPDYNPRTLSHCSECVLHVTRMHSVTLFVAWLFFF